MRDVLTPESSQRKEPFAPNLVYADARSSPLRDHSVDLVVLKALPVLEDIEFALDTRRVLKQNGIVVTEFDDFVYAAKGLSNLVRAGFIKHPLSGEVGADKIFYFYWWDTTAPFNNSKELLAPHKKRFGEVKSVFQFLFGGYFTPIRTYEIRMFQSPESVQGN